MSEFVPGAMKGITLARYLMIVNITMRTAAACFALPQQEQGGGVQEHVAVDTPVAKISASTRKPLSDLVTQPSAGLGGPAYRFVDDQKQIWTSPFRLNLSDAQWLVPFAGVTSGLILTDPSFSRSLPSNPHTLHTYNNIRTGTTAALGAASGGFYLWSLRTHDPHQRETGLLAGEAVINSLIVSQSIQLVTSRERPTQGNRQGSFFQGGTSFPSNHSAAAWAAAGVLAHEYPGAMTKLLAYGLASTVSVTSVTSKQHFPSDVLIGSALGWMVSEYVYRRHHNPELGGAAWNPLGDFVHHHESGPVKNPGSTYVPLDSWVYPAFDRLTALGYVSTGFEDRRPWSREQCAHLLLDADKSLANSTASNHAIDSEVIAIIQDLHREFAREEGAFTGSNNSLDIESIYSRVLSANGAVLDDGYHFGQTVAYDFGRPFREGTNFISGGSASATYESLFFYFNGEYQYSPSAPALSLPVREFIAERDKVPLPPGTSFSPINRFQLLDAYAGINLQGWQISFGNQSLSWGPGIGGSLLLSDNAGPFPMLRISQEKPSEIPGLSKVLGPFTLDQFYGRLDGHPGPSQPWIYGQRISMRPLRSLEFSYSRTTLIGGTGHPLTAHTFLFSMFGRYDYEQGSVPGDSRTAFDWTWHVPGMHDRATFYGELEDDDDLIPFQNLSKSVWRPGFYFPRLPLLPKWDMHVEWTSSTSPGRASFQNHGNLNYWNLDYPAGYTNDGNLMGNTVGREGTSLQFWGRYWISPRHTLDLSWKKSTVLSDYVPGGGRWQDVRASYSVTKRSGVYLKSFVQFEHITSYPLLFSGERNNFTAAFEIGFLPQWAKAGRDSTPPQNISSTSAEGGLR